MDIPQNLSATTLAYLIICLLVILLISTPLLLRLKQGRGKLPPGPWRLPVIGNLHQLGAMPHRSLHNLALKHGPLMFLMLGSIPTLVISSSAVLEEAFKSHDVAFSGRPRLYAVRKLSYGFLDMAFAPYGEYWRQLRKVSVLELLSLRRVQSFCGAREQEVALMVESIRERSAPSAPATINLSETMLTLSNNAVCRAMFGGGHGGGGYEKPTRLHAVLGETQKLLGGFCVADFFPRLAWIHGLTGLKRRLDGNFDELDRLYNREIDEHGLCRDKGGDHVDDLVDVLLRLQKDSSYGSIFSSTDHIKGLLADMFIAGTDTSAATLVWTMTELVRNPAVMERAKRELRAVIGDKATVRGEDTEQLRYLKLVVKEALRLHPPLPLLVPRETTGELSIGGYTVPPNTRVFVNAMAISTDPGKWERPCEFWPERFLDIEVDFRGTDFDLVPFGFGRRGCPGINSAVALVELALASLLHWFDWELPCGMAIGDLDTEEAFGLVVHKKNPLCLVAIPKQPRD